jgi:hypothetical protein
MSLLDPEFDYLVRSFAPGFMDSPEPDTLPKGATPDAKNCLFGSQQRESQARATLEKRNGARLMTPAQVVAGKGFDGLFEFRKLGQSSGRLVAVVDGKVWYWDGATAFVQIGVTAPFVSGTKVQFAAQRNLLFIMDGSTTRVWDGVIGADLFTPGEVAPTSAPTLTDGGAGTLPAGTYEGFAVWYDSTHDHETSPSAISAQLVLAANRSRNWAKPTGAPGGNYDKWRVYCRRVDTNETYYKRVVDAGIATANVTEQVSDATRNLSTLGPLPLTNNPPPLDFVLQSEYQGYRLAVRANDDQIYVSKINDPQAQSPNDIIGVSRGTGGEIRSILKFGTNCVVQKAQRTAKLRGDRMPFVPDEVHSTFGNVGQSSAVEVSGKLFCWDEEKGPYWTDLNNQWEPIATAKVQDIVNSVPKNFAKFIECVYVKAFDTVFFSLPASVNGRRRTLLGYNVTFDSWLPPITGLEYACLAKFVDSNGATNLYVGDYWGRLFQYFTDFVEGAPSGSLIARVSASTSGTVTCDFERTPNDDGTFTTTASAVAFYTAGAGLAGLPVLHIDAAGNRQWRRAQSNTATVITLDTTNDSPWNSNPAAGDTLVVGAIDWYWRTPLVDFGDPFRAKKGQLVEVQARPGSSSFGLSFLGLKDGYTAQTLRKVFNFGTGSGWGSGLWGSMVWGGADAGARKARVMQSFFAFAFEVNNPYPNQPVAVLSVRLTADRLSKKAVASGGG